MDNIEITGVLEVTDKGFGFLRNPERSFVPTPEDTYVSTRQVSEFFLREGCCITGEVGEVRRAGQNAPLQVIKEVNGIPAVEFKDLWEITNKVAIDPTEKFKIEMGADDYIGRAVDLLCPIGKGQRGLIVSPPKVGKTTCLKHIAQAIRYNHPKAITIAVLIDERPEEVTDFQRTTGCEVFSSSLDEKPEKHIRVARLAFAYAKLMAEAGDDVVVLIDSLTRMTRAFNLRTRGRGKTLSGGMDAEALAMPKRFFGAARNFRGKGSLSVLASILIDTGSRMDEVIFQEYKGTGNMELVLDRELANKEIWPAININESGTRKEEKLLKEDMEAASLIRRKLSVYPNIEGMQELLGAFRKTENNKVMLDRIAGRDTK